MWLQDNVKFKLEERFIKSLYKGTLKYIIDSSFYPTKSKYISAVWFASEGNTILASREFITTVAEEYRHPFMAKICGVLLFLVTIDYILYKYPNTGGKISILVESDCQGVIDNLWNHNPIIPISKYLH